MDNILVSTALIYGLWGAFEVLPPLKYAKDFLYSLCQYTVTKTLKSSSKKLKKPTKVKVIKKFDWILAPILECPYCMTSVWGTILFLIYLWPFPIGDLFTPWGIQMYLVYIIPLFGSLLILTTFITKGETIPNEEVQ